MTSSERQLEEELIEKLRDLKYEHRADIRDRAALESELPREVRGAQPRQLTDGEFQRLLDEIVTPDVFTAAHTLRNRNSFTRDDGTPLNYTLVNINDWCKNTFEVVNQLRINTDYSHHRYDVILLINGVPVVQIELKTLGINPRRAMEQIVDYKNDPGNGYTQHAALLRAALHRQQPHRHLLLRQQQRPPLRFNADERFLPIYQFAGRGQHEDHPPRRLRRDVPRQVHARPDDQPLHGARRQRAEAADDAAVPDLRRQEHRRLHRQELRQRLHLAHHRQRQDAHLFKASTLLKDNPTSRNASSSSTARTSTARPARSSTASRKAASRRTPTPARSSAACSPTTTPTRSSSAPSRSSASPWTKTASATSSARSRAVDLQGAARTAARQAHGLHLRRMPPLAVRREPQGHQGILPQRPALRLHRHADLRGQRQLQADRRRRQTLKTTQDLFQKQLHAYTITHAIEDRNVLRFHVDYYKPEGKNAAQARRDARQARRRRGHPRQARRRHRRAQVQRPPRHRVHQRRHRVLRAVRRRCRPRSRQADPDFVPLNIAASSPRPPTAAPM